MSESASFDGFTGTDGEHVRFKATMTSMIAAVTALLVIPLGQSKPAPKAVPAGGWQRYNLANMRMSVYLPGKPDSSSINVSNAGENVKLTKWAILRRSSIQLLFNYTEYTPGTKVNLRLALDSSLETLKNNARINGLKPVITSATVNGVPALRAKASFEQDGEPVTYVAIVAGRANRMWQAISMYSSDGTNSAITQKSLGGWQIKP